MPISLPISLGILSLDLEYPSRVPVFAVSHWALLNPIVLPNIPVRVFTPHHRST